MSCISAWHVSKPQVVVMHGAATDNNATLFAQGYDGVLNPLFKDGKYTAVAHTAGTWDAPTQENEFQAVYTAHPNTNAALVPNDTTNAPIVTYLQSLHVKPKTFPTTGQDASLVGLQNVLAGYQCGTVYKPNSYRGADLRRPGPVPASGREAAEEAGERHHEGHDGRCQRPDRGADAEVGDRRRT